MNLDEMKASDNFTNHELVMLLSGAPMDEWYRKMFQVVVDYAKALEQSNEKLSELIEKSLDLAQRRTK